MITNASRVISRSDANLFRLDFNLKGTQKREFVYRYDLVDRVMDLNAQNARAITIREEDE